MMTLVHFDETMIHLNAVFFGDIPM